MRFILVCIFLLPSIIYAQNFIIKEGVPNDLKDNKIIFLKHEKTKITANKDSSSQQAYLHLRQTNHNKVIIEANEKLKIAASNYPFSYVISSKSSLEPLIKEGCKYLLDSRAYNYDNLAVQPNEDELIIYEFFIRDLSDNIAYKVFELDEMKVYDSKLIIKKLNRKVKKVFPEAY